MAVTFIEKTINTGTFTGNNTNSSTFDNKNISSIGFTETVEIEQIIESVKIELMAYIFDGADILASDFDTLNLTAYDFDYWQPKGG